LKVVTCTEAEEAILTIFYFTHLFMEQRDLEFAIYVLPGITLEVSLNYRVDKAL
jgi:hypothetical protein